MRATAEIEEVKGGSQIVVTELPYHTSATAIAARIGELANEKTVEGIRGIDNFSAGDGTRLVIGLKRDVIALVVLNNLYKHPPMQSSFAINLVTLVDGVPRTLNLASTLTVYVADQVQVITRRSVPPPQGTRIARHRRGMPRALDVIDAIIALIRALR